MKPRHLLRLSSTSCQRGHSLPKGTPSHECADMGTQVARGGAHALWSASGLQAPRKPERLHHSRQSGLGQLVSCKTSTSCMLVTTHYTHTKSTRRTLFATPQLTGSKPQDARSLENNKTYTPSCALPFRKEQLTECVGLNGE